MDKGRKFDRRYNDSGTFFKRPSEKSPYYTEYSTSKKIKRLGVFLMIIASVFLILLLDVYTGIFVLFKPLLIQVSVSLYLSRHYLLFLILLSRSWTLPFTAGQFGLRLLDLRWKTRVAVKILVRGEIRKEVVHALEMFKDLTWYTLISINPDEQYIILEKTRRILPQFPSHLSTQLMGMLLGYKIQCEMVDIPDLSGHPLLYVNAKIVFQGNEEIVSTLVNSPGSSKLLTEVRYVRSEYDRHRRRDEPVYQVRIALFSDDYLPLILYLGTLGLQSKIYLRRVLQYGGQNHLVIALITLLRILFLELILRIWAGMRVNGEKAHRYMQLPIIDDSDVINTFRSPASTYSSSYSFGHIMNYGQKSGAFGIVIEDLARGGIISGAIGSGKTTLRLHLMKFMVQHGFRIIDFDLKGDATKYKIFADYAEVIVPNVNFSLNPFSCPQGFTKKEYSGLLIQHILETLPETEELSPPQVFLFTRAVHKTVEENGNSRDFFENIMQLGSQQQEVVNINQELSAVSLIVKFDWMQTTFADIFWKQESSLLYTDYASSSLLFDLSKVNEVASSRQIRFLINLIMSRIMATLNNTHSTRFHQTIFLDEAQLLMPRRSAISDLTKLEQTVSTLRYRGISVVATGVSAKLMSSILLDVGFVAQFRSESTELLRTLALDEDQDIIPQLPDYHALIKSRNMGSKPVLVSMKQFVEEPNMDSIEPVPTLKLGEFTFDFLTKWTSKLSSLFQPHLRIIPNHLKALTATAREFVSREFSDIGYQDNSIARDMEYAVKQFSAMLESEAINPVAVYYPQEFLITVLRVYLEQLITGLRYDTRLNLIDRNLGKIVESAILLIKNLSANLQTKQPKMELSQLNSIINLIRSGKSVSDHEASSFLLNTITGLEYSLRVILDKPMLKLYQLIDAAAQRGIISAKQSQQLHSFRVDLRNPYLRGQKQKIDLAMVFETAMIVVKITEEYNLTLEKGTPLFRVS